MPTSPAAWPPVRITRTIFALALLSSCAACAHRIVQSTPPVTALNDNSYLDLAPGSRLKIVLPIGNPALTDASTGPSPQGSVITLSAANLTGYQVSYYSVEAQRNGRVRLKYQLAETTTNGKTVAATTAPDLPFRLPLKAAHIRLIYLVRSSQADHNMAIAAAHDLTSLNAFTNQLRSNPAMCQETAATFCSWVPLGAAVRPVD